MYRGHYTKICILHWLLDATALMFHKYVCTNMHVHVYIHMYINTYMCVCTYVFMHVFGCVRVCVYNPLALGSSYSDVSYICIYTYICT